MSSLTRSRIRWMIGRCLSVVPAMRRWQDVGRADGAATAGRARRYHVIAHRIIGGRLPLNGVVVVRRSAISAEAVRS